MEKLVRLHDKTFRLYLSENEILTAVREVANRINNDIIGRKPLLVPILNGSFMFASDLMKELKLDCEISFIKAASYHGTSSTGNITELIGLHEELRERHVIIIEDIIDTGHTLSRLLPLFLAKQPASVRVATLLFKPAALRTSLQIDYIGKEIPNDFIVGYGLDYDGLGRNLRDIYVVHDEVAE